MNMHWEIFGFILLAFTIALIGGISIGYSFAHWRYERSERLWNA